MRYELTDFEWVATKPFLPNKPRGVPRVKTGACSMASFGFCVRAHRGAICRRTSVLTRRATIASFAGGGLASGVGL
jgi:hypothetical protein